MSRGFAEVGSDPSFSDAVIIAMRRRKHMVSLRHIGILALMSKGVVQEVTAATICSLWNALPVVDNVSDGPVLFVFVAD